MAIREAGARLAAEAEAARKLDEQQRAEAEQKMNAARRSIDLLDGGLETLGALLDEHVEADMRFSRKAHANPTDPSDVFYLPATSRYVHWYTPTQKGWWLTTSARWDGAVRLLGESDLRVAVLANGKLSRTLLLDKPEARVALAREIIECAARHDLRWPADGPNLARLLENEGDVD